MGHDARFGRRALLIASCVTACLERNPDFDGPGSSSATAATLASDPSAATQGPGSATTDPDATTGVDPTTTTGPTTCEADGYEPNDEQDVTITLGTFSLMLETIDGVDRYNLFVADAEVPQLHAAVDTSALRVCTFVRCEGTPDPALVTCTTGLSGGSEDGSPGCCGGPAVAMEFTCNAAGGAKAIVVVDQAPADCTAYGLELSTTPL